MEHFHLYLRGVFYVDVHSCIILSTRRKEAGKRNTLRHMITSYSCANSNELSLSFSCGRCQSLIDVRSVMSSFVRTYFQLTKKCSMKTKQLNDVYQYCSYKTNLSVRMNFFSVQEMLIRDRSKQCSMKKKKKKKLKTKNFVDFHIVMFFPTYSLVLLRSCYPLFP
jgi:hypothetical protein